MDDLTYYAEMHESNWSILDIPEGLQTYEAVAKEIIGRLESGDYDISASEMLALRKKILQRQKALGRIGAQYGFYLKSAVWFAR
jgi:hypothetical protein